MATVPLKGLWVRLKLRLGIRTRIRSIVSLAFALGGA